VVSDLYFDKYRFESDPLLLNAIAQRMSALIPEQVDALAGLELGGIPLVTALSRVGNLPALFVRKQAKQYGTCNLVEGGPVSGRELVLVEDVVTSGGQIITSARQVRELGAAVHVAICAIDREAGAKELLEAEGIELRPAFRMTDLERAAGSAT
jgi:orotate phosphoribosyltransferase